MDGVLAGIELRTDFSSKDLRALARKSDDGKQTRRLMALASILDGLSRAQAAKVGLMDRQTLRDWVHRFNAEGPTGLKDRKSPGPGSRLTPEQHAKLKTIISAGPDLAETGLVRWRCVDLAKVIKKEFKVEYHESTVGKLLHSFGFPHIILRVLEHPNIGLTFLAGWILLGA
jgi:transposase